MVLVGQGAQRQAFLVLRKAGMISYRTRLEGLRSITMTEALRKLAAPASSAQWRGLKA